MPFFKDTKEEISQKTKSSLNKEERKKYKDNEIFYMPLTDEIFPNYEEYISRTLLYKQKIWTCKYTNRSNLTYMAALSSEENFIYSLLFSKYDPIIIKQFCCFSENSKDVKIKKGIKTSEDLCTEIYDFFFENFIKGEKVILEIGSNL
jgi:hypothetical protein